MESHMAHRTLGVLLACLPKAKVGFSLAQRGTLDQNVYVKKSLSHGDVYKMSFYLLLSSLTIYNQHDKEPKCSQKPRAECVSYPTLESSSISCIYSTSYNKEKSSNEHWKNSKEAWVFKLTSWHQGLSKVFLHVQHP